MFLFNAETNIAYLEGSKQHPYLILEYYEEKCGNEERVIEEINSQQLMLYAQIKGLKSHVSNLFVYYYIIDTYFLQCLLYSHLI